MHLVSIIPNEFEPLSATADRMNELIKTYDLINIEFIDNSLVLPMQSDLSIPKYLIISLPEQFPPNQNRDIFINDLLENYELKMNVGGNDLLTIPFSVMNYFTPYTITRTNKLKLEIPFEKFFKFRDGIPIICLVNLEIIFKLVNRNSITTASITGEIIFANIFYNNPDRRNLSIMEGTCRIKEIYNLDLVSTTEDKRFKISGSGLVNGILFQIKTPNMTIDNINNIIVELNGVDRISLNADIMDIIIEKISPTIFYLNVNFNGRGMLDNIDTNTLNIGRFSTFGIRIITNLISGFHINAGFIVNNIVNISRGCLLKKFILNYSVIPEPQRDTFDELTHKPKPIISWQLVQLDFTIPDNITCPITYEPIDIINDGAYKCFICKNIFGFTAFKTWLSSKDGNKCPLCRTTNIQNTYYKKIPSN